ncbi:MAG TPA: GNAT family N-acetyltransferase [Thermoflexales bacterium]|jgi:N-acetylglutamate synthase-like GNAT family acetyltransferase|nr:GNAT family N-acetyltransferase [Thermoflexales bacterium]HQX11676.1 GNAT family N-acetyltransferase [Thermoflexales bacterium]HQY23823.1 GNAT family N-acetyltransferase [Thermoflexales bacterium]HQZ55381.1 GNAT family N-acetyltransferase [Thermoflexales bacterium]HRA54184.1 GNAT family N-acetyltransferase [Thermoflexales bacterium]
MTPNAITVRRARRDDLAAINIVEAGSTPGLRYVARVFDDFVSDEVGEFSVAEIDGQVVACGKFTVMPDHSAWLETLRVLPAYQGRGAGKRLYERFFEVARREGVTTMRMYTGVTNLVSKGLAERFGFRLAGTFRGAWLPLEAAVGPALAFVPVTDPARATALLMPHAPRWTGFVVMNRTFYALTPILCADFARAGRVFEERASGSVVVLGARFMPEQALHIGMYAGDTRACLDFAAHLGVTRGASRVSCLFPPAAADIQAELTERGYRLESADFIVMENGSAQHA